MKSSTLSHSLHYAWFIVVPPMLVAVLGAFFLNSLRLPPGLIYGCGGLAVLSFLFLHSAYSRMQARIAQHIANHKDAETNSAPFVLLLRSFWRRSGYSIEESGQVLLAGSETAFEQHTVDSLLGNLDLSLRKHALTVAMIGQSSLSLPESHRVLIVECPDDLWQANLRILACNAKAILLIPETTNSVVDEIDYVKRHGLLGRTIFLMPPMNKGQTEHGWWVQEINFQRTERRDQRWAEVKEFLADRGVLLPPYDPAGALFTVGESGGALKIVTLDGKDDVDAFDLAFRQVLPMLSGEWLPLKAVYGQLVPGKRYFKYDPISDDDLPGETRPFANAYVSCMLMVTFLGTATVSVFAVRVLGRYSDNSITILTVSLFLIYPSVLYLGILSMGAYIRWVFSKHFRSKGESGDA